MCNAESFMRGFQRAHVRRAKQEQHIQKVDGNGKFFSKPVDGNTKIKSSASKLTDEQYKTIITSKMITYIKSKGATK
jgi:hypothetical protein